jgi:hypothetical protein
MRPVFSFFLLFIFFYKLEIVVGPVDLCKTMSTSLGTKTWRFEKKAAACGKTTIPVNEFSLWKIHRASMQGVCGNGR